MMNLFYYGTHTNVVDLYNFALIKLPYIYLYDLKQQGLETN